MDGLASAQPERKWHLALHRLLCALLLILPVTPLLGESSSNHPTNANADLLVRDWQPGTDFRQRSVVAMLKTRDGYLWVGTNGGLMRFDGVSFTAFTQENTPGMEGDSIGFGELWEDPEGVLWAGVDDVGVLFNDHGRFRTLRQADGLPDERVLRIDGDETGAVWIYTMTGVCRWQKSRLERMHPENDGADAGPLIPYTHKRTIDFSKTGLWRHTPAGLERFAYGRWTLFPTPPREARALEQEVQSIFEDHRRRVWFWIASQPGRYFCADGLKLRSFKGFASNQFVSYQDSSGYLWLNDHSGHAARWKDNKLYPLPSIQSPYLLQVMEELDGALWAGTFATDLFSFRARHIQIITTAGAPEVGPVLFKQRSGAVWAGGTQLMRLGSDKGGEPLARWTIVPTPAEWETIVALSEDREGHLLAGVRGVDGVQQLVNGRPRSFTPSESIAGTMKALLLSSSGEQWIGTETGLYRFNERSREPPKLLWHGSINCLAEPAQGTIWAGTDQGPVVFRGNTPQQFETWRFGAASSIDINRHGEVWVSTPDQGIVRFAQNRLQVFGIPDGLPTAQIDSVNFDEQDDLWLRSDIGLLRVRDQSVRRKLENPMRKLQVTLFNEADGVPAWSLYPNGNESTLARPGGELWFASRSGILSLHPRDVETTPDVPRVVVEEHSIDESGMLSSDLILIHPGQSNLQVHYTALGSKHPEQLVFRYRLHGYDSDWIYANSRRTAYYTHLPAGKYRFEVQVAESDKDLWEARSAAADVQVLTPFYRSWWMKTIVVGASLFALFFFIDARRRSERSRRLMGQAFTHRLIATQEGERKRIAHELHDSLGQHLVLIRTLALLPRSPADTAQTNHLGRIADQAAVAIQEVENISYDLRPYQLDRLGLTKTVLSLIRTFESSGLIRVIHSVENIDGFFPKEIEINFYRIVQEALSNILKHAHATEVTVTVARMDSVLRLVVADNGRGLQPSVSSPSHDGLGLIGMQERAETLGGHATIESADRQGTKIIVTVAAPFEARG